MGWSIAPRGRLLRLLCDAYGLSAGERVEVLDAATATQRQGYDSHRTWAAAGDPAFARMWAAGSGDLILADLAWLDAHRGELDRALR